MRAQFKAVTLAILPEITTGLVAGFTVQPETHERSKFRGGHRRVCLARNTRISSPSTTALPRDK